MPGGVTTDRPLRIECGIWRQSPYFARGGCVHFTSPEWWRTCWPQVRREARSEYRVLATVHGNPGQTVRLVVLGGENDAASGDLRRARSAQAYVADPLVTSANSGTVQSPDLVRSLTVTQRDQAATPPDTLRYGMRVRIVDERSGQAGEWSEWVRR